MEIDWLADELESAKFAGTASSLIVAIRYHRHD
jgi:hypothetical protein